MIRKRSATSAETICQLKVRLVESVYTCLSSSVCVWWVSMLVWVFVCVSTCQCSGSVSSLLTCSGPAGGAVGHSTWWRPRAPSQTLLSVHSLSRSLTHSCPLLYSHSLIFLSVINFYASFFYFSIQFHPYLFLFIRLVNAGEIVNKNVFTIHFDGGRKSVVMTPSATLLSILTPFCLARGLQLHGTHSYFLTLTRSHT